MSGTGMFGVVLEDGTLELCLCLPAWFPTNWVAALWAEPTPHILLFIFLRNFIICIFIEKMLGFYFAGNTIYNLMLRHHRKWAGIFTSIEQICVAKS